MHLLGNEMLLLIYYVPLQIFQEVYIILQSAYLKRRQTLAAVTHLAVMSQSAHLKLQRKVYALTFFFQLRILNGLLLRLSFGMCSSLCAFRVINKCTLASTLSPLSRGCQALDIWSLNSMIAGHKVPIAIVGPSVLDGHWLFRAVRLPASSRENTIEAVNTSLHSFTDIN